MDEIIRNISTGLQWLHTQGQSFWVYIFSSKTLLLNNCSILLFPLGVMVSFPGLCGVPCFLVLVILWWVLLVRSKILLWLVTEWFGTTSRYGHPLDPLGIQDHYNFQSLMGSHFPPHTYPLLWAWHRHLQWFRPCDQ